MPGDRQPLNGREDALYQALGELACCELSLPATTRSADLDGTHRRAVGSIQQTLAELLGQLQRLNRAT